MSRIYAIDANGLGHWLFHANRIDNDGNELTLAEVTKNWFAHFSQTQQPQHVVAFFDGPDNWRMKEHVEYKSSRLARPPDEEKKAALKTLPQAWADLGVKTLSYAGFEADDAIAALCNVLAPKGVEVIIVSSDKDMMQLVNDRVKQYDPRPNKQGECVFYDEAKVEEKMGVPPHRVCDLLAIMGDSSDDVPGVDDWGKVAAVNAVRQTKSLRELVRKARAGELKNITTKKQTALAEAWDDVKDKDGKPTGEPGVLALSLRLVQLRLDVPVPAELEAYVLWDTRAA